MRSHLLFASVFIAVGAFIACGGSVTSSSSGDGNGPGSSSGKNPAQDACGCPYSTVDAGAWSVVSAPVVGELSSIWGSSANDAWIAADSGLLHWDGSAWSTYEDASGTMLYSSLTAISGTSQSDAWLVGGTPGAQTFAIAISHFDGSKWSAPSDGGLGNGQLFRVWATSPTDVWAVGKNESNPVAGIVLHYDGTSWKDAHDDASVDSFSSVWASGANDVWIASRSSVVHYDGSAWTNVTIDATFSPSIRAITGANANDVWAAGTDATNAIALLYHFDGETWTEELPGNLPASTLTSVDVTSSHNVWIGGALATSPTSNGFLGFGTSYPGAGTVVDPGNLDWAAAQVPANTTPINAVWGPSTGGVWAVGAQTILHHD